MKLANLKLYPVIYYLAFILFIVLLTGLFNGGLSHIIYRHEQYTPVFRFSSIYFSEFLAFPAGLLDYVSAFVIQFFYYPLLGAIILSLLIALVFILNVKILHKISGNYDKFLLSALPALFLLMQYSSIDFPISVVVGIIINQLLFLLFSYIPDYLKNYLFLILFIILFYIIGVSSFLFLFYFTVYSLQNKKIILPLTGVAIFGILIFISAYFYRVPLNQVLTAGLSKNSTESILLLLLFLPSVLSVYFLSNYFPKKKITTAVVLILLGTIYILAGFWGVVKKFTFSDRLYYHFSNAVDENRWNDILMRASKLKKDDELIAYFTNLALFHTGVMKDKLFDYPQNYGSSSLFLFSPANKIEYLDLAWYGLGFYNYATQWAFESMVRFGETAPALIKLAKYNMLNKKPLVAQKYMNVLDETLFYASHIDEIKHIINDDSFTSGRSLDSLDFNLFINNMGVHEQLLLMSNYEPENKMAFEYLMSYYLLNRQIKSFGDNLWRIKAFPLDKLSGIYEQALVIYETLYPEEFEQLDWNISDNTRKMYAQYSELLDNKNYRDLKRLFGKTYWYYAHFTNFL